jgi:hypothetical protein
LGFSAVNGQACFMPEIGNSRLPSKCLSIKHLKSPQAKATLGRQHPKFNKLNYKTGFLEWLNFGDRHHNPEIIEAILPINLVSFGVMVPVTEIENERGGSKNYLNH